MSSNNILTTNNVYKLTFDITDNTNCTDFNIYQNAGSFVSVTNTVGSYTYYITNTSNRLFLFRNNTVNSSISLDNISITDVSSDFDFDRASSATRINSSGLVQDMQSITDPELVQNGDFEELGDEDANYADGNVTFTNDSGSISTSLGGNNYRSQGNSTTNDARPRVALSNSGLSNGKTYKVVYTPTSVTGSSVFDFFENGTRSVNNHDISQPLTFYFTSVSSGLQGFDFDGSQTFSVDYTLSVQQVDPNDRWNAGNKWSISGGTANKATDATSNISQAIDGISGKLQKVVFTVSNYGGSGGVGASADGSNYTENEGNGTFTEYITPNSNNLYIRASYSFVGSIDNVSVKEATFSTDVDLARINYDSNGENGHILLEPTSTNLVTYSQDIDSLDNGDGEVAVNSTLTYESDVVAPDGSLGVYRIQNPATASTYLKVTNNTTAAQSMSVWVKAKTVGTNNQFTLYRDGTGSSPSDVKIATGDWQRFEYSWSTVGSGAYFINNDGDTYASDLYVWGLQVENLPYNTSYIPTLTGSTVTRVLEKLTGSGNSTLINSTEGVLYAEIAALANDATNRSIALSDGTTDDRVNILFGTTSNRIRAIIKSNNSTSFDEEYTVTSTLDYHKVAIKYKANDFALWIDGVERFTDTSGSAPIGLNQLKFDVGGGTLPFYGKCKALAVFNEALEDDELELLTGVTNYPSFGALAAAGGYTII